MAEQIQEKQLQELIRIADMPYGYWNRWQEVIDLAKTIGKEEIIRKYAILQRKVYENSGLYFNNAGTPMAKLKITPDNWMLDGCDSLELSSVQRNYIQLLIDEGQKDKAQNLLKQILEHPDIKEGYNKRCLEKLFESLNI